MRSNCLLPSAVFVACIVKLISAARLVEMIPAVVTGAAYAPTTGRTLKTAFLFDLGKEITLGSNVDPDSAGFASFTMCAVDTTNVAYFATGARKIFSLRLTSTGFKNPSSIVVPSLNAGIIAVNPITPRTILIADNTKPVGAEVLHQALNKKGVLVAKTISLVPKGYMCTAVLFCGTVAMVGCTKGSTSYVFQIPVIKGVPKTTLQVVVTISSSPVQLICSPASTLLAVLTSSGFLQTFLLPLTSISKPVSYTNFTANGDPTYITMDPLGSIFYVQSVGKVEVNGFKVTELALQAVSFTEGEGCPPQPTQAPFVYTTESTTGGQMVFSNKAVYIALPEGVVLHPTYNVDIADIIDLNIVSSTIVPYDAQTICLGYNLA